MKPCRHDHIMSSSLHKNSTPLFTVQIHSYVLILGLQSLNHNMVSLHGIIYQALVWHLTVYVPNLQ
jgi:hypothetical protein